MSLNKGLVRSSEQKRQGWRSAPCGPPGLTVKGNELTQATGPNDDARPGSHRHEVVYFAVVSAHADLLVFPDQWDYSRLDPGLFRSFNEVAS